MARLTPQELKAALADGLLAFPLTDFDAADALDTRASAAGRSRPAPSIPASCRRAAARSCRRS